MTSLTAVLAAPMLFGERLGRRGAGAGRASGAPRTRPQSPGHAPVADLAEPPAQAARPQDGLILAIARDQDRNAFIALFEHFAPRVKSYLLRLGGADLAEEMAQEAMLMVWRKAGQFDPHKASASTWIFTIARNLYIDRKRKERRPEIDPSDPMLVAEADPAADIALSMRQSEQLVRAALATLPPEQARVIELSFFADKPHAAIAAELDLPLGTVKSRLRLALARLRGALGEPDTGGERA